MSGRHAAPRRTAPRPARPWTPVVVALVGALGLVGGLGTQAYWNDVETVSGATVTSGSLDLLVEGQQSYTWTALDLANIAPGESTAKVLTLNNAGTTPFTISVTGSASASDAALLDAMRVTVVPGGTVNQTSVVYPRAEDCTGTPSFGPQALTGSETMVLTASDVVDPWDSLTICVRLQLDLAAANETQSDTYTPTFTLTATQVAP